MFSEERMWKMLCELGGLGGQDLCYFKDFQSLAWSLTSSVINTDCLTGHFSLQSHIKLFCIQHCPVLLSGCLIHLTIKMTVYCCHHLDQD